MERYVKIEADKGELNMALVIFYIYEFDTPNLVKINNVKNTKKRNNTAGGDGDGIDNDSESELLV